MHHISITLTFRYSLLSSTNIVDRLYGDVSSFHWWKKISSALRALFQARLVSFEENHLIDKCRKLPGYLTHMKESLSEPTAMRIKWLFRSQ